MNKYRIYIDEVGNNDLNSSSDLNHRYLSLTGVIFDLKYVVDFLNPEVEDLKRRYFGSHPDEPIILHRKELINKKHPFESLKDNVTEKKFNEDILDLFTKWQYKVITVVIDKFEHSVKYQTWKYDPYHYCMEILIERFYYYLKSVNAIGDVMVESRGGKEDIRLKKSFRRIMENGTHYNKADDLKNRITSIELKVKPKSANISGLQIADLIAYPSRKHVLTHYGRLDDNRITFNEKVIEIIKEKYDRKGLKLDGYGIKLLP